MITIENQTFDEERALYGSRDIVLKNCSFDGAADGESALKECSQVEADHCRFNLRYPFWHNHNLKICGCELTPLCRAALWYSSHIQIHDSKLHGIKALRECEDVVLEDCDIQSPEFGWTVNGIQMHRCTAESEYFMMHSKGLSLADVKFKGKYSFQYTENAVIENCVLDTKDAFWHAQNVTIKNCTVKGEYLAWYSEGLTLIGCTIIGTQPFCYCKNLKLIDCAMIDTDLAFEKSEVEAAICTPVISIKNPLSGRICVPAVEAIILDDEKAKGEIIVTGQNRQNKDCTSCVCA